jgi:hypothetical protein
VRERNYNREESLGSIIDIVQRPRAKIWPDRSICYKKLFKALVSALGYTREIVYFTPKPVALYYIVSYFNPALKRLVKLIMSADPELRKVITCFIPALWQKEANSSSGHNLAGKIPQYLISFYTTTTSSIPDPSELLEFCRGRISARS